MCTINTKTRKIRMRIKVKTNAEILQVFFFSWKQVHKKPKRFRTKKKISYEINLAV